MGRKVKRQKRKTPAQRRADRAARRKAEKRRQHPLAANCESPIEVRLLFALSDALQGKASLRVQVPVGPYRADFMVTHGDSQIVVEADGKDWHTSPEAREYDGARDAFMRAKGIRVLRFTGSEITRDAKGCAGQVAAIVAGLPALPSLARESPKRVKARKAARRGAWFLTVKRKAPAMVATKAGPPTPPRVMPTLVNF